MKKLFSMILALALVLGMSTVALAADTTGTITVKNVTDNTLLDVYQILTYTRNGDNNYSNAQFAGENDKYKNIFIEAINEAIAASSDLQLPNLKDSPSDLDVLLYITNNLSADSAFAKSLGEKLKSSVSGASPDETKTANDKVTNGTYTFNNVETGYYLILDKTVYGDDTAKVSVVLQPMNPNVEINLKSNYIPPITKVADKDSVSIGDVVTYTITVPVPQFEKAKENVDSFIVTDTLGEGLTIDENSFNVTLNDGPVTNYGTKAVDGQKITLNFSGITSQTFGENIGKNLVITYTATVNDKAGNTIVNGVATNDYFGDMRTTSKTVHTYGFNIDKFDADSRGQGENENTGTVKLQGVEFKVYTTETGGDALTFTKGADDKYYYDATSENVTLVTDVNGAVHVWGLKAGTYYLEETKPNPGYNDLTERVPVEVGANGAATVPVYIANTTAIVLPGTGGMGTTLFTVLGGGLMLSAVVALFIGKKRLFNS